MQDLVTDNLASKRIPAASTLNSLPREIAGYAKAIGTGRGRPAYTAGIATAKPKAAGLRPAAIETDRVYTGPMAISGTLSADNGQNGNWTGTLKSTLYVEVDAAGNGTGYEHFSGNITLHVGDRSSTEPLTFDTPTFSLTAGKFDYPSGFFSYKLLSFTLDVKGSFRGSQQTIQEHLSLPFIGSVNGVGVTGSMNGSASMKTSPLSIDGTASPVSGYAAAKVRPFGNTIISDLSGTKVTATVALSRAANGTLTNLAGGTYDKATGVYTITGSGAQVSNAIRGLAFVSAPSLGASGHSVATSFTLHVTDAADRVRAVQTRVTTSNPLLFEGIESHQSIHGMAEIKPFQTARIGQYQGHFDILKIQVSEPGNGTLENLSGGTYIKKTGIYLFHGSLNAASKAMEHLEFAPTKSGVATKFTITAENTAGAFRTVNVTVTSRGAAVSPKATTRLALFSQYVAHGLNGAHDRASALSPRHDLPAHPLAELAGSHR